MVVIRQLYKGKSLFQQHSIPLENTEAAVRLSKSLSSSCIVKDNNIGVFELQNYTPTALSPTSANISNKSSDDNETVNNLQGISSSLTLNVGRETLDKTHNITRVAVIRMVVFTIVYLLMNISVSVETVLFAIVDKPLDPHLSGSDVVHSSLGIIFFLFFGTVSKRSGEKLKKITNFDEHV